MTEVCINGHTRTEENTRWHKRGRGDTLKRVCVDCRREKRNNPSSGPTASERAAQRTTELHEDIEDLIKFGATFTEIIARGGFSSWGSLRASLRRRDRTDLIEALMQKHGGKPPAGLSPAYKRKPTCGLRSCGKKRYAKNRCKPHYMQERNGVKQPNRTHCTLTDCSNKHKAKGYCGKHYHQQWRKGKLENTGD